MVDLEATLRSSLNGRYAIEGEVGRGGMSVVFRARDLKHNRTVVVKVLKPELSELVGADRFLREIETTAGLNHPHILGLIDSGHTDNLLFFIAPFVEGESLRQRLDREGPLPVDEAIRIACEVADGLEYAHRHGVLHRDIKPANILLADGHAIVCDFGIATALSEASGKELTQSGMTVGSPLHMSPEQATGSEHLDERSDIYSLAWVLFEMLVGEPPFTGKTAQVVQARRLSEKAPSLVPLRDTVPTHVDAAVSKALARLAADRFGTASEFARALRDPTMDVSGAGAGKPVQRIRRQISIRMAVLLIAVVSLGVLALAYGVVGTRVTVEGRSEEGMGRLEPIRLAVLPLENLGGPENEYIASGITEAITIHLVALSGLEVISRESARAYATSGKTPRQFGADLGVQYVLSGSVQWQESTDGSGTLRITPRLTKVSDDTHVWAEVIDSQIDDVFQAESDVAMGVASALNLQLVESEQQALGSQPTDNVQAYRFYLRGNEYYGRSYDLSDREAAIEMYERAISLDPDFALAYAALSLTHSSIYRLYQDRSPDRQIRARTAAETSLQLDPNLAHGHLALGFYYFWTALDYETALRELTAVEEIWPNDSRVLLSVGYIYRSQGRWREAEERFRRAVELDPVSAPTAFEAGATALYMRQYERAAELFDRAIELSPHWALPYFLKAILVAGQTGDSRQAAAVVLQASSVISVRRLVPQSLVPGLSSLVRILLASEAVPDYEEQLEALAVSGAPDTVSYFLSKADLYRMRNDPERAVAYSDSAREHLERKMAGTPDDAFLVSHYSIALAGLGRAEDAVAASDQAIELMPMSLDAIDGADWLVHAALVSVMIGQPARSIGYLRQLLETPSLVSPGTLRADPVWAPGRDLPGFRELAEH